MTYTGRRSPDLHAFYVFSVEKPLPVSLHVFSVWSCILINSKTELKLNVSSLAMTKAKVVCRKSGMTQ